MILKTYKNFELILSASIGYIFRLGKIWDCHCLFKQDPEIPSVTEKRGFAFMLLKKTKKSKILKL